MSEVTPQGSISSIKPGSSGAPSVVELTMPGKQFPMKLKCWPTAFKEKGSDEKIANPTLAKLKEALVDDIQLALH